MEEKISSGSEILDRLLEGGYERDVVTTIYGPAGSGKSTACLLAAIAASKSGKKALFIDTEGGYSVTRLKQLANDSKKLMESIIFLKPTTFEEQKKHFSSLKAMVNQKIGLIVVDTITNLYRSERTSDNVELNRELGRQMAALVELVRTKSIPVLLTNQVYSDMEPKKGVRMVGGDIIAYNSKCLIELKLFHGNKRSALLHRHRNLPQREVLFEIRNEGFVELKDSGFRLF
ncbi:DNA repair and recombination protein RadB [Candidatus Woesearchaeota archaeon]|nr:DNA repair and recombination protein RadB [Candidatus Woesearchaeota archaeon]